MAPPQTSAMRWEAARGLPPAHMRLLGVDRCPVRGGRTMERWISGDGRGRRKPSVAAGCGRRDQPRGGRNGGSPMCPAARLTGCGRRAKGTDDGTGGPPATKAGAVAALPQTTVTSPPKGHSPEWLSRDCGACSWGTCWPSPPAISIGAPCPTPAGAHSAAIRPSPEWARTLTRRKAAARRREFRCLELTRRYPGAGVSRQRSVIPPWGRSGFLRRNCRFNHDVCSSG